MIAEIEVTPLGSGIHLAGPIARIVKIVADSGLDYQVTSMGTIFEGDPDDVWSLVRQCHEQGKRESERVITQIRIDDDPLTVRGLHRHVQRVEEELHRLVNKSA